MNELEFKQTKLLKRIQNHEIMLSPSCVSGYDNRTIDNNPLDFIKLSDNEKITLVNWIVTVFKPIKTVNKWHSSYGLKHLFEHAPLGFYVKNGAFKGAMLIAGFEPVDPNELNWRFRISEVSIGNAMTPKQWDIVTAKEDNYHATSD